MIKRHRIYSLFFLILLAGSLTLILQKWVGSVTLYQPSFCGRKQVLHKAILYNLLPPGHTTWTELGANGVNIRIATVYFAEGIHRVTNFNILTIYKWIDTIAIFASFLLLFAYLRKTSSLSYSLIGLLYVAAILPLTYFFAYFHPWDRVSLALWIILLMLLRSKRLIFFTSLLVITITVKYDTVLLPGLYILANITWGNWFRIVLRSIIMFSVSLGTLISLYIFSPDGFKNVNIIDLLFKNLKNICETQFSYPPLLGLFIPISLAIIGFRRADRFSRASVVFGILLCVLLIFTTNFIEIRAEMPILLLMLPSAIISLQVLCEGDLKTNGICICSETQEHV
ncbi:MAG: hypothetical protein ABIB46_03815 [bacterium]